MLNGQPRRRPSQHSAFQIDDMLKPSAPQNGPRAGAPSTRAADDDDVTFDVAGQLGQPALQGVERNEQGAANVTELADEFLGLAHIEEERRRKEEEMERKKNNNKGGKKGKSGRGKRS